jgi:hypothetical protein
MQKCQKLYDLVGGGFSAEIMRGCYQKIVDRSVSIGIDVARRFYTSSFLEEICVLQSCTLVAWIDMGLMYFQATKTRLHKQQLRIKSAC